ncbi:preprotein translocase subunit YajC [Ectothiorhodospiraceae bacterium 2226]|nr:preprotein translocase subunit YajC [Ectothiorhodospiraceae bacterium 2226]
MSFFISDAWAQAAPAADQPGMLATFLPLIILFVVFYFLLIRPQLKRAKDHRKMVTELAKGDEIVTNGGLVGRIIELGENFMVVEVADNIQVKVQRQMISSVLPKGTMKTL